MLERDFEFHLRSFLKVEILISFVTRNSALRQFLFSLSVYVPSHDTFINKAKVRAKMMLLQLPPLTPMTSFKFNTFQISIK